MSALSYFFQEMGTVKYQTYKEKTLARHELREGKTYALCSHSAPSSIYDGEP